MILAFLIMLVLPLLQLFTQAFYDKDGAFIGVANFSKYFTTPTLVQSLQNTVWVWEDYVNLCQQGGSKSFLELVEVANLTSPFAEGCVKSVITEIEAWLHAIDDTKL